MFRDQEEKRHDNIPSIAECAHNNGLSAYSAIEDAFIPSETIHQANEQMGSSSAVSLSWDAQDPPTTFKTAREDFEFQNRREGKIDRKGPRSYID